MNSDNTKALKDKRILLLAPPFFNYEKKIEDKMTEMGAHVDAFDVRSVTRAFQKALLKISPVIFANKSKKYYNTILESVKDKQYDYIVVVKCDMMPVDALKELRRMNPDARISLYLWDSVKNIPGIKRKFSYFDALYSFDRDDCERYRELKFRPLFFADEFCREYKQTQEYKHDLAFIGTVHSDRYRIIRNIDRFIEGTGISFYKYMYLQSRFIYYFYRFTKKEFRKSKISEFAFDKKSSAEIADVIEKTKVVLDMQHPKQTGLTMRTIEMLGMNKKLITTNRSIADYDFYNKDNIRIIERDSLELDMDFFKTPYHEIDRETYERYSLSSWIMEILGLEK